jgi:hypothetical protein
MHMPAFTFTHPSRVGDFLRLWMFLCLKAAAETLAQK